MHPHAQCICDPCVSSNANLGFSPKMQVKENELKWRALMGRGNPPKAFPFRASKPPLLCNTQGYMGHSGEYGNAAKLVGKMSKSVMRLISIHF